MFQKILVPLDFSDYTDEIMNVAVQIAAEIRFGDSSASRDSEYGLFHSL